MKPTIAVGPELVCDPATEQDQDEARRGEVGEHEAHHRYDCQRDVADESSRKPHEGSRHQSTDCGGQPVEELIEMGCQARLDVENREAEHEDEARQHEAEAGEEAAELAAAEASEV